MTLVLWALLPQKLYNTSYNHLNFYRGNEYIFLIIYYQLYLDISNFVGTTENVSPSTRKSSENESEKLPSHEHGDGNSNNISINTEQFGIPEGERGKGSYLYIYMHDYYL